MRRLVICGGLLFALALSTPVAAGPITIIDTGPGPSSGTGYSLNPNYAYAREFTIGSVVTITSMQAWLNVAGVGNLNFGIYLDDVTTGGPGVPGQIPGTELFTDSVWVPSGANSVWLGVTGVSHTLQPGTYWFVVSSPASGGAWATLPYPSTGPLGNGARNLAGGGWGPYDSASLAGYRVNGLEGAVPDLGSSLLLLGIGTGFLGALRRRFR